MNLLELMYLTKQATLQQEWMEKGARRIPSAQSVKNFFRAVENNPSNKMQVATRADSGANTPKLPSTTDGVVKGSQSNTIMGMRRKPRYDPKNYLTRHGAKNFAEQKYDKLPINERMEVGMKLPEGVGTQRSGGIGFGPRAMEVSDAQRIGSFYNQTSALRNPRNSFLDFMQQPGVTRTDRGMIKKMSPGQKKAIGAGTVTGTGLAGYGGYQLSK